MFYDKLYKNIDIDISSIIMFILNNSRSIEVNYRYDININEDIYYNIENYLKGILRINNINLEDIYQNSKIIRHEEEFNFCGIYRFPFPSDKLNNLQRDLILIYRYLTDQIPKAQFILLCNKETSTEELISFLYRAILCQYNSCFIITGIELLQFKQKMVFQNILDNLYKNKENEMKSCLIAIFEDINDDIIKNINDFKNINSLKDKIEIERRQNINLDLKVKIIECFKEGIGKSTYIKAQIENQNKECIYFPLGGDFTKKDVLIRLKELKNANKFNNGILHLDLYDTEQIELMNEFLFSILITKIYGQNDEIFYLPYDLEIMIEKPNGFNYFINKFPILQIFSGVEFPSNFLESLIVENRLDSNIQIVANYLKLLNHDRNSLNTNDIYFEGINPNIRNFALIQARVLPQGECQDLIFDKIREKIENPNYYHITIFINILGTQLRKFSQN